MRILVTGFPPFPGRPENPTQALIEDLHRRGMAVPGATLIPVLLPVEYAGVERAYLAALERYQPDLVLAFGVGRQTVPVRLEVRGANTDEAAVPDNAGEIRQGTPIDPDGPPAVENPLDLNSLARKLKSRGIEAETSTDAGRYICNHLNYLGLSHAAQSRHPHQFLFTHIAPQELLPTGEFLLNVLRTMLEWFQTDGTTMTDNSPINAAVHPTARNAMNSDVSKYWMGFDLGGTKMLAQVYDSQWKPIAKERKRVKPGTNVKGGIDRIVGTVEEALTKANLTPENLHGLGIGCPGPIDMEKGLLLDLPNLGWAAVPLRERLQERLKCPVAVLNDVDAGTYAEFRQGAAQGTQCAIGVFAGTGIGGGCVYHGEILRGRTNSCFEIGHVQVMSNGPRCGCGQRGCLESVASRLSIAAQAARAAYHGDAPHLLEVAGTDLANIRSGSLKASIDAGDTAVGDILKEAARYIGIAIAGVVNLINPEVVVLGGGLVEAMPEMFITNVAKAANKRVMPAYKDTFKVVPAMLKDDAGVLGAALWAEYRLGKPA